MLGQISKQVPNCNFRAWPCGSGDFLRSYAKREARLVPFPDVLYRIPPSIENHVHLSNPDSQMVGRRSDTSLFKSTTYTPT